jgi:hypothetical protein
VKTLIVAALVLFCGACRAPAVPPALATPDAGVADGGAAPAVPSAPVVLPATADTAAQAERVSTTPVTPPPAVEAAPAHVGAPSGHPVAVPAFHPTPHTVP